MAKTVAKGQCRSEGKAPAKKAAAKKPAMLPPRRSAAKAPAKRARSCLRRAPSRFLVGHQRGRAL